MCYIFMLSGTSTNEAPRVLHSSLYASVLLRQRGNSGVSTMDRSHWCSITYWDSCAICRIWRANMLLFSHILCCLSTRYRWSFNPFGFSDMMYHSPFYLQASTGIIIWEHAFLSWQYSVQLSRPCPSRIRTYVQVRRFRVAAIRYVILLLYEPPRYHSGYRGFTIGGRSTWWQSKLQRTPKLWGLHRGSFPLALYYFHGLLAWHTASGAPICCRFST